MLNQLNISIHILLYETDVEIGLRLVSLRLWERGNWVSEISDNTTFTISSFQNDMVVYVALVTSTTVKDISISLIYPLSQPTLAKPRFQVKIQK